MKHTFLPLFLLVGASSCAVPAGDESSASRTEAAIEEEKDVLYFDSEPVADVHVTKLGNELRVDVVAIRNKNFYQWMNDSFDHKHSRKNGAIVSANYGGRRVERSFADLEPIDIVIDPSSKEHPIRVSASGTVGQPKPTDLAPSDVPRGSGILNAIQVGCELLPAACSHVSSVRISSHDGVVTTDLDFEAPSPEELTFDPAGLGAVTFTGLVVTDLQSPPLVTFTLPAPGVVSAGSIRSNAAGASRTVVLSGSADF